MVVVYVDSKLKEYFKDDEYIYEEFLAELSYMNSSKDETIKQFFNSSFPNINEFMESLNIFNPSFTFMNVVNKTYKEDGTPVIDAKLIKITEEDKIKVEFI